MFKLIKSFGNLVSSLLLLATSATTGSAGSDETNLLAGRAVATHGAGLAKMLMVTTTMGMVHRVHGHTLHIGPAASFRLVLVVGVTGLEQGLVGTASAGDDADHGAASGPDGLLRARGELDAGLAVVGVVTDDGRVVPGSASEAAAVTGLLLNVADDGTFGHLADGHHVADAQSGLLPAENELPGVEALGGDEELLHDAVLVRVTELDASKRGATAGVVDDFSHNALHVAVSLGVVKGAELGGALAVEGVGGEDTARTTSATTDNLTHLLCCCLCWFILSLFLCC